MSDTKFTILFLLIVSSFFSCRKDDSGEFKPSSIKIIPTDNEPKVVSMISSQADVILAYTYSGNLITPPVKQEVVILNPLGEVQRRLELSDTLFQYLSAVPALNGGFMICGASDAFPYIALFKVSDAGDVEWSSTFQVKFGTNKNKPAITTSRDGNYLVMYQSVGSGYYIWKGDVNGIEIFNKKYPTPNAVHYGSGLNYGEKYVDLFQANDTLIITQGVTYDEYDEQIENCFLRAVSETIVKKWYSDNYDSTHFELGAGMTVSDNKIVLFGTRSQNSLSEYAGDVFARKYTLDGTYLGDQYYPRTGGTPTVIRRSISSPDGGYLLIGHNNQLAYNDLVSPTQLILIRLDNDFSLSWSRILSTGYPAKGYDAVYHKDGTIGLIGLLKDKFNTNKIIYLHLDSNGNLINS